MYVYFTRKFLRAKVYFFIKQTLKDTFFVRKLILSHPIKPINKDKHIIILCIRRTIHLGVQIGDTITDLISFPENIIDLSGQ